MQDFHKLKVWERAHSLPLTIYALTSAFPKNEQYGLTAQMRASSSSIPTNIAEGCGRGSNPDFVRFLQIGFGSATELEYQLLLSRDLGLITAERHENASIEAVGVRRMRAALMKTLQNSKVSVRLPANGSAAKLTTENREPTT